MKSVRGGMVPVNQTMKTLPEVIRDAMLLLGGGRESVVIARGQHGEPLGDRSSAFQVRIRRDGAMGVFIYRCEARCWLGGQWASWREEGHRLGGGSFDIDDVLATDWRISS